MIIYILFIKNIQSFTHWFYIKSNKYDKYDALSLRRHYNYEFMRSLIAKIPVRTGDPLDETGLGNPYALEHLYDGSTDARKYLI